MKPLVDILMDARALIQIGWCQGQPICFNNNNGSTSYCSVTALVYSNGNYRSTLKLARTALEIAMYGSVEVETSNSRITRWNDDVDRTKEEVIDAFSRAIELVAP